MTPEEEAYRPPAEVRPFPRGVIGAVAAVLAILLATCGTAYYRDNILPEQLYRRAALLFAAGDYEAALPLYEEILARQPAASEEPDLHYALGYIYEARGDGVRAAGHYAAFVESPVDDPEILLTVSRVLMKLGRYEEALSGFTRAGELLPAGDTRAPSAARAARDMLGLPAGEVEHAQ